MARASPNYTTLLVIDLSIFLAAGVLGTFAIFCIV
jgi:hypothetical protein